MPDLNNHSPYQYETIFQGLPESFENRALETFRYQYQQNPLYKSFADQLGARPDSVHTIRQIPFLPVSFFKTHQVQSGSFTPEIVFESSGTTGVVTARHAVKHLSLYRESFIRGFELFYGKPEQYCILGLLPAYLERSGSSLVYMVDALIQSGNHPDGGFYLYDFEKLRDTLMRLNAMQQPTILIGVGFALLDFAAAYKLELPHCIIMETGGMKGRRKEITRMAMHAELEEKLGVTRIHSEYGMTELLSQAYSAGGGFYRPVPWMKIFVREEDDPLSLHDSGEGLVNIIDLANRDSCSFIATDDVARLQQDGSFEILGRMDNSDIRGCSLLVA